MARATILTPAGKRAALVALIAATAATYSVAKAASSATLTLNGTISATCEFTTSPGDTSITLANGIIDIGELGYTCNLPDGSAANFTLQIEHGGLENAASGATVPYDVQWNVPPNDGSQAWQPASNFVSPVAFSWPVSPPGVERSGLFRIRITAPLTGLSAGHYQDVLTYTISP